MNEPTWERAKTIFAQISALPSEDREAKLEELCGVDTKLRTEVEELLGSLAEAGDFLGGISSGVTTVDSPGKSIVESVGTRIGPYKLLQRIGEGGFGTVYMAEQQEPVRRKVALKIIKLGMDTKQIVARFEAERQALALMDHPNIARVLDAGATDTGRPYFVMELIRGIPITAYCDQNNLDTKERLKLFLSICGAIQHAHQKGVIHRDIKPNNVMVTLHDGVPVPKVIDFGIAKAINQRLTEKTLFTEFSQFIGTPQYMSPEQAEMSGLDVDTRADIYSLGVLLYELLTGTTPLDAKRVRTIAFSELHRVIREEEAQRPSTRVSTLGDAASDTARHRATDVGSLRRSLSGDLDWIVMKALEKDRTRRYETANALLFDVRRHLENEPVLASPPGAIYRIQKFAKRNRTAVSVGSAILAALSVGLGLAIFGLVQADRERAAAQQEAAAAAEIAAFFNQMLSSVNPRQLHLHTGFQSAGSRPDLTARFGAGISVAEMLERAAGRIESSFTNKPLLEARARETIAASLTGLEAHEEAAPQLEAAMDLRRAELGANHRETLRTGSALVAAHFFAKRYVDALAVAVPLLDTLEQELGVEDPITLFTRSFQAGALVNQGRFSEADAIFEPTLAGQREVLGPDHRDAIQTMIFWANSYCWRNRGRDAEKLGREAYEAARSIYSPDDGIVLESARACALALAFQSRGAEALEIARPAYERAQRVFGPDHDSTVLLGFAIARSLDSVTNGEEEAGLYANFVRAQGQAEWVAARDLGELQLRLGKTEEGLETLRLQHEFWNEGPGPDVSELGQLRVDVVRRDARQRYYRALVINRQWEMARKLAPLEIEDLLARAESDSAVANDFNDLAMAFLEVEPTDLRDPERALVWAKRAVEASSQDSSLLAPALDTQALAHRASGHRELAFELNERALEAALQLENIRDFAGGLGYYVAEVARHRLETEGSGAALRVIEDATTRALENVSSGEIRGEVCLDIGRELKRRGWHDWAASTLARSSGEFDAQDDRYKRLEMLSERAEAEAQAGRTAACLRTIAKARQLYEELFVREEIDWHPGLGFLGEDGERTWDAVRIKRRLALALLHAGRVEEADSLAFEVSCVSSGFGRLPLAHVHVARGNWKQAAAYYRDLYHSGFFRNQASLNAGPFSRIQGSYGRCLTELGRYAEAEPHLLQAHARTADTSGGASLDLPVMAEWIQDLYRRWGKPELVAEWES